MGEFARIGLAYAHINENDIIAKIVVDVRIRDELSYGYMISQYTNQASEQRTTVPEQKIRLIKIQVPPEYEIGKQLKTDFKQLPTDHIRIQDFVAAYADSDGQRVFLSKVEKLGRPLFIVSITRDLRTPNTDLENILGTKSYVNS